MQIRGKIFQIGSIQSINGKNGVFTKREFVLDCTTYDTYTGEARPNFPMFTLMSKHINDIDAFKQGDEVNVSFIVSGRAYEKDGNTKYFNEIVAYKIEPVNGGYRPIPQQGVFPSQNVQQPMAQQPIAQQSTSQSVAPQKNEDDLPF